jgi:hypothetical protein
MRQNPNVQPHLLEFLPSNLEAQLTYNSLHEKSRLEARRPSLPAQTFRTMATTRPITFIFRRR